MAYIEFPIMSFFERNKYGLVNNLRRNLYNVPQRAHEGGQREERVTPETM